MSIANKKRVAVVTGTRAEYGLLRPVCEKLRQSDELALELVVTGAHLSERYGMTVREIEADGLPIAARIPILTHPSTDLGTAETIGDAVTLFAQYFAGSRPDCVLVLGDRYEIFAAATAAAVLRIPLAHISGGDVTQGAADEFFRHAVTKMAALHFPSCAQYAARIIRMGEEPQRVFNVGGLGDENIRTMALLDAAALSARFNFDFSRPYLLVTYHPATLGGDPAAETAALLAALDAFPELGLVFTRANADAGGETVNRLLDEYAARRKNAVVFASMGALGYLSAMRGCAAVVGNSSSGVVEAPSFHKPTVNIGDRQKGRLRCRSILDCEPQTDRIVRALKTALSPAFAAQCRAARSPYNGGDTSGQIVSLLAAFLASDLAGRPKAFYDLAACAGCHEHEEEHAD